MIYIVDRWNAKLCCDSIDLCKYTRDEVFDKLEEIEDRLLADLKKYMKNGNLLDCRDIEGSLSDFEDFWKLIQNSSVEEFYMLPSSMLGLNSVDPRIAYSTIHDFLLYNCKLTLRTCDLVDTVEQGRIVAVKTETIEDPAYVPLYLAKGADTYIQDTHFRYDDAVKFAKEDNEKYRIFKCKDCGKITRIERTEDAWKLSKGLSPVKRCEDCIIKRRYHSDN